jgi:hypothetical protein
LKLSGERSERASPLQRRVRRQMFHALLKLRYRPLDILVRLNSILAALQPVTNQAAELGYKRILGLTEFRE